MFELNKNQFDAFRIPLRKARRDKILADILEKGIKAYLDQKDIIVEDSKANKTRLVFDEYFILQKLVKPSGLEYHFTFDDDDQLLKLSLPGNESLGFEYDGELLRAILVNNKKVELNYDESERVTEVVAPDRKSVKIGYDNTSKVESITNRENEVERYSTTIKDNRLIYRTIDGLKRVTEIETDPLGSGNKITFPDGLAEVTTYDEVSNTYITTLRNGNNKTLHFEGLQPSRVEWEDGDFVNIVHHKDGASLSLENPNGTLTYKVDNDKGIIEEQFQDNKVKLINNENGVLDEIIYPSNLTVKYGYDEDGRLKSIKVASDTIDLKYGINNTVEEILYPNRVRELRDEKLLSGLHSSRLISPLGQTIFSHNYDYDSLDRLTSYRSFDEAMPGRERHWNLAYDAESRLLSNNETNKRTTEHFKYDAKGNLIAFNNTNITVGAMDNIESINGNKVAYDKNGNVKSYFDEEGKFCEFEFNNNNELKFARANKQEWEYWYDAMGRRIGKSNGNESYKFFWTGEYLLTEAYTVNKTTTLREYIYGPGSTVPIAFRENNKLFIVHADARGAVIKVTSPAGETVWSAEYTSFGEAMVHINKVRQPWRLMGQYHDEETNLNYSIARYYSLYLKSFLSIDPLWHYYEASNYSYAANDPYNKVDRNGRLPHVLIAAGVSAAVGTIVGAVVGGVKSAIKGDEPWWRGALRGGIEGGIEAGAAGAGFALAGPAGYVAGAAVGGFASAAITATLDNHLDRNSGKEKICVLCEAKKNSMLATVTSPLALIGGHAVVKEVPKLAKPILKEVVKHMAKSTFIESSIIEISKPLGNLFVPHIKPLDRWIHAPF